MKKSPLLFVLLFLIPITVLSQTDSPELLTAGVDRISGSVNLNWLPYDQDVLSYNDGTLEIGYTTIQGQTSGLTWALRFSPEETIDLLEVGAIVFDGVASDMSYVGLNDIQFLIFSEGPDTLTPGAVLYTSETISPENSGWVTKDLTDQNLSFSTEFWVGISFLEPGGPFVGFDTDAPLSRRYCVSEPPYNEWYWGTPYDIMMQAIVGTGTTTAVYSSPSGLNNFSNSTTFDQMESTSLSSVLIEQFPSTIRSVGSQLDEFIDYNIYRNNVLIGQTTSTSYTDQLDVAGDFTYYVTADYDEGESEPSNPDSVYWHANMAPPVNINTDLDEETGEVDLTWQLYNFGQEATTVSSPTSTESVDGNWNWADATFCQVLDPGSYCRLVGVRYQFAGGSEFGVKLYDFDGSWPTTLFYESIAPSHIPGWTYVDLQEAEIFINSPIAVGFNDLNGESSILYNDSDGALSFLQRPNGTWGNFNGGELSLHIEMVVEYPDGVVTSVPATSELDDLSGFRIHRNDDILGEVSEFNYSDILPTMGTFTYAIETLYDEGESRLSEPVNVFWQENLAVNADFELWANNVPVDWDVAFDNNGCFQETENVHSGSSAVRSTLVVQWQKRLIQVYNSVQAGEEYTFSAWYYDNDQYAFGKVIMFCLDETGSPASGGIEGTDIFSSSATIDSDAWQQLETTGVIPEGTDHIAYMMTFAGTPDFPGTAELIVDDCKLFGPAPEIVQASIEEIQTTIDPGTMVQTSGIVTIPEGVMTDDRLMVYIQDETDYGIRVFGGSLDEYPTIQRGDSISVMGILYEIGGNSTIMDDPLVRVISSGNSMPDVYISNPLELASAQAMEGRWVEVSGIRGEITQDNGINFALSDTDGNEIPILLYEDSDLNMDGTQTGDEVTIQGVIQIHGGAVEIVPALQEDIVPATEQATIAQIQTELESGSFIFTSGIVTVPNNQFSSDEYIAYIQDGSGYGVKLLSSTPDGFINIERGDNVLVTGTTQEIEGITSIDIIRISIESSNNPIPEIFTGTPGEISNSQALEGRWVQFSGFRGEIVDDELGSLLPIYGTDDDSVYIRLFANAGLSLEGTEVGTEIMFHGVIWLSDNTVQVAPVFQSDMVPVPSQAAPTPTESSEFVTSIFSNEYDNVTVDSWSADWDQANLADVQIEGNDTKLYTDLVFAAIEFTSSPLDISRRLTLHLDIWTADPTELPAVFKVKLVDFGADGIPGGDDNSESELTFDANSGLTSGTWVSFDILLEDFVELDGMDHIGQLLISGDPNTVYVDNIFFYGDGTPVPEVAAPTPTHDTDDVISMFSNAYEDVTVDSWSTTWDEAEVEDIQIDGNDTKLYTEFNYAGIVCDVNPIDATGFQYFHLDIWTPDNTDIPAVFRVKLSDYGPDGAWSGGDDSEHELVFDAEDGLASESWVSFDIPMADFTGLDYTNHIGQVIISGDPNTVYVDNVYFHSYQAGVDDGPVIPTEFEVSSIYPNPFNPSLNIVIAVPEMANFEVTVFDVLGRKVRTLVNGNMTPGYQTVYFNANNLSSGIYFVRVVSPGNLNEVRKVMLVR